VSSPLDQAVCCLAEPFPIYHHHWKKYSEKTNVTSEYTEAAHVASCFNPACHSKGKGETDYVTEAGHIHKNRAVGSISLAPLVSEKMKGVLKGTHPAQTG
jgi:hypothetical protein